MILLHIVRTVALSREKPHSSRMREGVSARVALLTTLLLVSLLVGFSSAQTSQVRLEASFSEPSSTPWFEPDQPLTITPSLVNDGPVTSVENDPSCDVVLMVYNATDVLVNDGTESCRGVTRGMDLFEGETRTMDQRVWDMKDSEGNWLPSGEYTIQAYHPTSGLSVSTMAIAQTPVDIPEVLSFHVERAERVEGVQGPEVLLVNVHNPTSRSVDLSDVPVCFMEFSHNEVAQLAMPCFGGVTSMMPNEMLYLGHILLDGQDDSIVSLTTPGDGFSYVEEFTASLTPTADMPMNVAMDATSKNVEKYANGDVLAPSLMLSSTSTEPSTLEFTSSCKAEYWVINDLGDVVFDSRANNPCQSIDLEMELTPSTPLEFPLPQWSFLQTNGCSIAPGAYTMVAELPEFGLSTSMAFEYGAPFETLCLEESELSLTSTSHQETESTLLVNLTLEGSVFAETLRMAEPCAVVMKFYDENALPVHQFRTLCNDYDGRKLMIGLDDESAALTFPTVQFSVQENGVDVLPEGQYRVDVSLATVQDVETSFSLQWPFEQEEITAEIEEEVLDIETFEIAGQWVGLLTDSGTCWVMETQGTQYMLHDARTLGSWTPTSEVNGIYTVYLTESSSECSGFSAPSVTITKVTMEQSLEAVVADPEPTEPTTFEFEEEETPPVVQAAAAVATASILSILLLVMVNNESLRIPTTVAGLWFLGLMGKTHETTDGRYQRGRLMGYLTANPGCHFRALMAALDMSNGQITHHLRILEAEENIWRKKDGRLVRYYPITNQLHPSMPDEALPVPPLSPDPNSLQGKILNLLDSDGQLGDFPTQAELAKRLEKSQQLISHHLRTLQKYGLVERRKMGVKNRYKLTREAIFLLESNDDFSQDPVDA